MNRDEALGLFREAGAYLDGHFLLTSGRHSDAYIEKFRLLEDPVRCARLCADMARHFADLAPTVVVGPAVGGILLAYETARALGVRGIFLEREEGRLKFRRGFALRSTDRILVVEDVVTTGTSVFEVLEVLAQERREGRVLGVACLVDRSGGKTDFGLARQRALLELDLPSWEAGACPLCAKGIPLTQRGSRSQPGTPRGIEA